MLVFGSRTFDLARGWFGMFVLFSSGGCSGSGTCKFYPSIGVNPNYGVKPLRGESSCCGVRNMCLRWEKFHQRSREVGTLEGEIHVVESGFRLRKIPFRSNMIVCR